MWGIECQEDSVNQGSCEGQSWCGGLKICNVESGIELSGWPVVACDRQTCSDTMQS